MKLFFSSEIRAAEKSAFLNGFSDTCLMKQAGNFAAEYILHFFPQAYRYVFFVGGGNNGGDAIAAAIKINELGKSVIIFTIKPLSLLTGAAAAVALEIPQNIICQPYSSAVLQAGDCIIDGLLGIGFSHNKLREEYSYCINLINSSHCPVISLDVPSGMHADTGDTPDEAVKARITLTFGLLKQGLFALNAVKYRGQLRFLDIGLEKYVSSERENKQDVYSLKEAAVDYPHMENDCNKFTRGKLTIYAGSKKYSGAPALVASAAIRSVCGLVELCTPEDCNIRKLPNAVILNSNNFSYDFSKSSAIVAGPGWGNQYPEVLVNILRFNGPLLLDADGLNILSRYPALWQYRANSTTVLTPHTGELKRLLEAFELKNAQELSSVLNAVIVAKGTDSRIYSPDGKMSINSSGTFNLATAGSGDVLSGIIGGLLAYGIPAFNAAKLGVFVHGLTGELGLPGCIADDLPELLPQAWKIIQDHSRIY